MSSWRVKSLGAMVAWKAIRSLTGLGFESSTLRHFRFAPRMTEHVMVGKFDDTDFYFCSKFARSCCRHTTSGDVVRCALASTRETDSCVKGNNIATNISPHSFSGRMGTCQVPSRSSILRWGTILVSSHPMRMM